MFLTGCRLAGLQAARLVRLHRSIAAAPTSLLDLLTGPPPAAETSQPVETRPLVTHNPENRPNRNILGQKIANIPTLDEFLKFVEKHGIMMDENHLLGCWFKLSFVVNSGADPESIKSTRGFQELVRVTCLRTPLFVHEGLIRLLRVAHSFSLPADSELLMSVTRSLENKLKSATLGQIMVLRLYLESLHGESEHFDVVKLSLPVIFQARVRRELDTSNPKKTRRALVFALSESMDAETCEFLGNAFLPFVKNITTTQAFRFVEAAANNEPLTHRAGPIRQILSSCIDKFAQRPSELAETHIRTVLECCEKQRLGSRALFEAFWSRASEWPFDMMVSLLRAGFCNNYLSLPAAEFATELILSDDNKVIVEMDILRLAEAVALVALRHDPKSEMSKRASSAGSVIANAEGRIDMMLLQKPHLLAEFLLCLATVGLFPEKRLSLLFDDDFQRNLLREEIGYSCMVELERLADLGLGKSHPYKVIPELKALAERDAEQSYIPMSLSETLRVALGGERFFVTRAKTPLGTRADYIVVLRRGDYAMAFPDGDCDPFEKIPPDSKVIAILIEKAGSGTFDHTETKELLKSLRVRNLRAQNIGTLTVNLEKFEETPLHERTPFVMKSFKDVVRECPAFNGSGTEFNYKW